MAYTVTGTIGPARPHRYAESRQSRFMGQNDGNDTRTGSSEFDCDVSNNHDRGGTEL